MTAAEIEVVGAPPIPVRIRRSARAKRLTLRLSAVSGEVSLTVPQRTTRRSLHAFLTDHLGWIERQRAALPPRTKLAEGTVLSVCGTDWTLAASSTRKIQTADSRLLVPALGEERGRTALRGWLKATARDHVARGLDGYSAMLGLPYGRLSLRDPRTRWGSCSGDGNIMLSWRLVFAPPDVMDYVVAHEVAHLAEMNHSPAYWSVLAKLYPDYAVPQKWLRTNGAALHRIGV